MKSLEDLIADLWPEGVSDPIAVHLERRQREAFTLGLSWIGSLCERWEEDSRFEEVIHSGATLQLYARVLDDQVDEGFSAHRDLLLRAQPILWSVVQRLTSVAPQHAQRFYELVSVACTHNESRLRPDSALQWAHKNEHLLIFPLCFCEDEEELKPYRDDLRATIWSAQASDELLCAWTSRETSAVQRSFHELQDTLDERCARLVEGGWPMLARRHLRELLNVELRLISENG